MAGDRYNGLRTIRPVVMNYRLIATEVGELLKWDAAVKQIDRMGRAIFPFAKDIFPNDSISSVRAKAVWDWILTLARQNMGDAERNDLLVEFCQKISPTEQLRIEVEKLLVSSGVESEKLKGQTPFQTAASTTAEGNLKEQRLRLLLNQFLCSAQKEPQQRGYDLQSVLNDLFKIEGIEVTGSFTRNAGGEQIDGAFRLDGWFYLVECRWRQKLTDIREVDGLKGQVDRSGKQALGIFLSMEGWSHNVPDLMKQNPDKSIFLMDGFDLMSVLRGQIPLRGFLAAKNARLTLDCRPYYGALDYQKDRTE